MVRLLNGILMLQLDSTAAEVSVMHILLRGKGPDSSTLCSYIHTSLALSNLLTNMLFHDLWVCANNRMGVELSLFNYISDYLMYS